jgi:hypothetical protein
MRKIGKKEKTKTYDSMILLSVPTRMNVFP